LLFGVVVGLLNSECPQQNRAYESKYGADSQHIELQGKVHGSASLVDARRLARNQRRPKVPAIGPVLFAGEIAYRICAMDNRLIVRLKKSEEPKILTVQNSRGTEFFMANLRQIPSILRAMIPPAWSPRNLAVNKTHDDFGCAPNMRDRKKSKNGGHRPSRDECLEPTGHEVDAQADIGESDDGAHHEDDQCADENRKNESPFAFHGIPLVVLPAAAVSAFIPRAM